MDCGDEVVCLSVICEVYYDNGQLERKFYRKKQELEGPWVNYSENGQIIMVGNYKNGKEDGEWKWFEKDGSTIKVLSGTYKNGEKISD